ncbi:MAG: mRNA interferase YafQ [Candidatus Deianiraeaceae bacterium]|jgi:mRNA interferase YafQ
MIKTILTNGFIKQYKLPIKRNKNIGKLDVVIRLLANNETLPPTLKDHTFIGNYKGFRDLHIEPDWLLIYRIDENYLILEKTGTHSDYF